LLAASAPQAHAQTANLIAVLPLNAPKVDKDVRDTLEESLRTVAGRYLTPVGFIVLTGENTLRILADNGIDASKVCEASCALDAAKNLKASLFISGSANNVEGEYVVFLRLFDGQRGIQLGSVDLSARTAKALREQLDSKAFDFFSQAHLLDQVPAPSVDFRPPPKSTETVPSISKGDITQAVGHVLVGTHPRDGVRLDVVPPSGKSLSVLAPYENRAAELGRWRVKASAAGYEDSEREFDVLPDDIATVKMELKRLGTLRITAVPSDTTRLEVTNPRGEVVSAGAPYTRPAAMVGEWKVAASATGHESREEVFMVEYDRDTTVAIALNHLGNLVVNGAPAGATVSVSGPAGFHDEGSFPWRGTTLKTGTYRIHVARDGYAPFDDTAEVRPAETVTKAVRLQRLTAPMLPPAYKGSPPESAWHKLGIAGIVLGGIGLAVGTGLEVAAQQRTAASKATPQGGPVQGNVDAINAMATGAVVGWVAGGTVVASGLGLAVAF
jgi:hypothetical protein